MRNPLARLVQRAPAKQTLRERLAATKARAKQVLAVNRTLMTPPKAAPAAPNRTALTCYSTWLAIERRRVQTELYPHMGRKDLGFIMSLNAGWLWHRGSMDGLDLVERPPATERAIRILDMLGVAWRDDEAAGRLSAVESADMGDSGERPPVPRDWPAPDAELVAAVGDLKRLEAAIKAVLPDDYDDANDVPGYTALREAQAEALTTLRRVKSETLEGLRAKARVLLSDHAEEDPETFSVIACSLARDLLREPAPGLLSPPDPIFAAIEESRRLMAEWDGHVGKDDPGSLDPVPEFTAASEAFHEHANAVLLVTLPRTAAGCQALAAYARDFQEREGWVLDSDGDSNEHLRVLDLIARSPLL